MTAPHKIRRIYISLILILLLLNGCLDFEGYSDKINLKDKTCEVSIFGFVSTGKNIKEINEDFRTFIEDFYLGAGIDKEALKEADFVSKEFYVANNRLNVKALFTFKNKDVTALIDLGINRDSNGDYYIHLNSDNYVRGNAIVTVKDDQRILKWSKDIETIEYEVTRGDLKDKEITSLLPYWLDWKKTGRLEKLPTK